MKTNIIIAIAGVITLVFFLCIPEGNVPVSILFGFSAVGIGSTIKFLVLNIPKIIKRKDKTDGDSAEA
jgi:hypothetical protein